MLTNDISKSLEKKAHKYLWNFEMQRNRSILTRRPGLVLIKSKRTFYLVDFAIPADDWIKVKESKKINSSLLPESLKIRKMKMTVIPTVVRALGLVPKKPGKETVGTEDKKKKWDFIDYSTFKIL